MIFIPTIATQHNIDISNLRKVIKSLKIKTKRAYKEDTKKSCTVITKRDYQKLLKHHKTLTVEPATSADVPITQLAKDIAKIRKWKTPDISSTLKMLNSRGIEWHRSKFDKRSKVCINIRDYNKVLKEIKERSNP